MPSLVGPTVEGGSSTRTCVLCRLNGASAALRYSKESHTALASMRFSYVWRLEVRTSPLARCKSSACHCPRRKSLPHPRMRGQPARCGRATVPTIRSPRPMAATTREAGTSPTMGEDFSPLRLKRERGRKGNVPEKFSWYHSTQP